MRKLFLSLLFTLLSFVEDSSFTFQNGIIIDNVKDTISMVNSKLNSGLDYMFTKRVSIKIMILASPVFASYCYFYGVDPVLWIMNNIVFNIGYYRNLYAYNIKIGSSYAFWNILVNNPLGLFSISAKSIVENILFNSVNIKSFLFAKKLIC